MLADIIFGLPFEYRYMILDNLNNGIKKRIFDTIPVLTDLLNLNEISDYNKRVKIRRDYIDKYPNEVHWDYMEYYPCKLYDQDTHREYVLHTHIKVSTNGDVIYYHGANKRVYINLNKDYHKDNYNRVKLNTIKYAVHRLVGTLFIPIPETLKDKGIENLITNHIDLVKSNDNYLNLEWTTNGENVKHSFNKDTPIGKRGRKTGESYYSDKYILLEVLATNRFKGRKFVINGLEQCKEAGLEWKSLYYVAKGERTHNYGFGASYIPAEETEKYPLGMPEDIKELFDKDRRYFSMDINPIIGKYNDIEFSCFGAQELNKHFVQANVLKVISGERKEHKKCTWRYGTLEEGIALHDNLTPELIEELNR